jgi:hypothetical protein
MWRAFPCVSVPAILLLAGAFVAGCKDVKPPTSPPAASNRPAEVEKPPSWAVPEFDADVPQDVRELISGLLAAYHRGDGEATYSYLSTEREKIRIADAYAAAPIPIINPRVSSPYVDNVQVTYEIPLLGDLVDAIMQGGEDIGVVKQNLLGLVDSTRFQRRTENWSIIRTEGGMKVDYYDKGILRLADLMGTQTQMYSKYGQIRWFLDAYFQEPVPRRVVFLSTSYILCYDIEPGSPEHLQLMGDVFTRLRDSLKSYLRVVDHAEYHFKVPAFWGGPIMGAEREAGAIVQVERFDTRNDPFYKDATDEHLRKFLDLTDGLRPVVRDLSGLSQDEIVESGRCQVGGVPAKWFVARAQTAAKAAASNGDGQDEPPRTTLNYEFAKNGVIYALQVHCPNEEFAASRDLFVKIKDSFRFNDDLKPLPDELLPELPMNPGDVAAPEQLSDPFAPQGSTLPKDTAPPGLSP